MIDIDSARRNFNSGPYDPGLLTTPHLQLGLPSGGTPLMDNHRALVHWNQTVRQQPPPRIAPNTEIHKSDEDDDDDDEDRPFTPPPPRERLSYTRYQLELLNAIYQEVRYPNSTQKQLIAKRVGITRDQVKIWFQNRRRKDVVGNSGKTKSVETSPGSTCSMDSKESEQQNSPIADSSGNTSSEENSQLNDSDEKVVPSVVLKSVINELMKFVNDPLKGKRKKKKSKSRREKEKADIKKGLAQTLLTGGYDMISPPNQITPTAFFDKAKRGFSHSKGTSAFANPRDLSKPAVISNIHITSVPSSDSTKHVSATTANSAISRPGNGFHYGDQRNLPVPGQQHFPRVPNPSNLHALPGTNSYDLPVLSDLHAYLGSRHKEIMQSQSSHYPSIFPPSMNHIPRPDFEKSYHTLNNLPPSRPLNGIFPFPLMAEHPLFLSSLRHPDQILRPSPQYPGSTTSDDPYQPLLVTSLPNPYFSSPATSWSGQTLPSSSSYTQL